MARLLRFLLVYLRVLNQDYSFLTFTFVTSFLKIVTLILLIMLMIIHRMHVHETLILSFWNFRKTPNNCRWFQNSDLISNIEKSHQIVSSKQNLEMEVLSCSIRNEDSVKLLQIHISNNLNFDYHVNQLCKKASKKLQLQLELLRKWTLISKEYS